MDFCLRSCTCTLISTRTCICVCVCVCVPVVCVTFLISCSWFRRLFCGISQDLEGSRSCDLSLVIFIASDSIYCDLHFISNTSFTHIYAFHRTSYFFVQFKPPHILKSHLRCSVAFSLPRSSMFLLPPPLPLYPPLHSPQDYLSSQNSNLSLLPKWQHSS